MSGAKKKSGVFSTIICIVGVIVGVSMMISGNRNIISKPVTENEGKAIEELELYEMNAGDIFEEGGYCSFEGVTITYNGTDFIVENGSEDIYLITCGVYGKKSNGEYDQLATVSFASIDEAKYQQELEENGWAVKNYTSKIRPGETLIFELDINGYISYGAEPIEDFDVDGDGYYDIAFMFSKQIDEDTTITSTEDPKSDYYKLKVE